MIKQKDKYVQGYLTEDKRVCQIIGRSDEADGSLLEHGAMFEVQFGDGSTETVAGYELSPWYPTD